MEEGKVTPVQEVPCLPSPAQDSESGYSSYAGSYGTKVIFFTSAKKMVFLHQIE